MPNQQKVDSVRLLTDKFAKAKVMFFTDYRGLTHQQLETLRKSLKKAEAELVIAKNTLLRIAMTGWNKEIGTQLEGELKNPTATLFGYGDELAPIKALADFMKTGQLPKVKMGYFAGKSATEADFKKLATLPTKEILLATMVSRMKSPLYGLHHAMRWNLVQLVTALDNVAKKKPVSAAPVAVAAAAPAAN